MQAGRHVGRIADRSHTGAHFVAHPSKHDRAAIEANANTQLFACRKRRPYMHSHRVANRQRCERGTPGMILTGDRRTEQRHEPVTEKLVHIAVVVAHMRFGDWHELVQHTMHAIGTQLRRQRGRTDNVAEKNGDLLALTATAKLRAGAWHRFRQQSDPAFAAEFLPRRKSRTAGRAVDTRSHRWAASRLVRDDSFRPHNLRHRRIIDPRLSGHLPRLMQITLKSRVAKVEATWCPRSTKRNSPASLRSQALR